MSSHSAAGKVVVMRPRIACAMGKEASVRISSKPGQATMNPSKPGDGYTIKVNDLEVLEGPPRMLKVRLTLEVQAPDVPIASQTFETIVVEGQPWSYQWNGVKGLEKLELKGTPNLIPEGMTFGGMENGKPTWVKKP